MLKRSQYLIAGVGMFLAVVILSGFLAAGDLPSGTMFLGDARHSGGETAGDLTIMPTLAWRFATQGPVRSTPAVFDGVVYVGSSDGYLYAVDGRDGHRIWSFAAGAPVNASPVVTSGRVFCAARDGRFFALDRTSGRLLWETPTGGLARYSGGWDYYTSSPLLTTAGICVGGGDGRVYMINPDTGKVTWSFETGGPVRSSPAEADGVVFAGSFDGTLYAIDETTGRLRWKFKCAGNKYFPKGEIQSSPVIWENLVLFGSRDYHIYALDRKTGRLRWKLQHKNSWVIGSPVVRDGVLYVGSSDGLFFQAVDSLRGVEKWRRQTESNVFSSALVAGDVVCFGCWDGDLYALKTATGDVAWRFPTGDAIMSTPVMAGGTDLRGQR